MRKIELLIGEEFQVVHGLNVLNEGDKFRMFEPDGEPVMTNDGETVFLAVSEPYWSDKNDTWVIDIDTTKYDIIN